MYIPRQAASVQYPYEPQRGFCGPSRVRVRPGLSDVSGGGLVLKESRIRLKFGCERDLSSRCSFST